jgi:preprotein translocase subunit SecD
MLNRYPLWKYLMLVAITVIAFIYSIPNIYVPDPAVQVSTESSGAVVVESDLKKIESALTKAEIEFFGSELSGKTAIVRVKDRDHQMLARKVIQKSLGDGYVVAMKNAQTTPQWLQSLGGAPMKLGLDLAGGVHFLLEVDTPSAITKRQEINADEMKEKLRKEKIRYLTLSHNTNNEIIGRFKSAEVRDNAISELRSEYPQLSFLAPEEKEGTTEFNFIATFTEAAIIDIEDYAIEQNLVALRNRVNELGVSEPIVQRQGRNRIIVQLPGVQDPAEAKRVIGKTANLEFRLSADSNTPVLNQEQFKRKNDREQAIEGNAILERQIIVTGDRVTDAQVTLNEDNLPAVSIKLDGQGGDKMYLVTRKNIKRPMGILFIEYKNRTEIVKNARGEEVEKNTQYVEKTVISEATIQSALGTNFQITGLGDAEAAELALLLRAGALAAPMHFVEERVIGPSLGAENIKTGVQATILGLLVVVVFMVIFYRLFGLFANIALALNVLLIMTILSWFGATLTLPGIAGIVLTIGMAVDANVLIFSRIREEMSRGASPQQAIFAGYERAFITIFDSNLTTFLVALILFIIGTGPVKGFAITLCVGIATSMFTAIVASRALVNLYYGNRKNLQKISIGSWAT